MVRPGAGVHPRCSGLRVQGTAISPTSAALFRADGGNKSWIVLYYISALLSILNFSFQKDFKILFTFFKNLL